MVAGVTGHGGLIGAGGPVDGGVLWPLRGVPKASLESRSSAVKGGFGESLVCFHACLQALSPADFQSRHFVAFALDLCRPVIACFL